MSSSSRERTAGENGRGVVLITGASGFLGRHLMEHYLQKNIEVFGVSRQPDAAIQPNVFQIEVSYWPELISKLRPSIVIHCAGAASVPKSLDDPLEDFVSGPALTSKLLDAVRRFSPASTFLFISSAAVYGNPDALPIKETAVTRPISPYGYHKLQSELSCEAYARIFGLRTASARLFSAYGDGLHRQVVWDLLNRAMSGPLTLRGTGVESRDFIHVNDVVAAIDLIARKAPLRGEAINVASGREVTIFELANIVTAAVGRADTPVVYDGQASPGMPLRWQADVERLIALGFEPQVSLVEGVKRLARSVMA